MGLVDDLGRTLAHQRIPTEEDRGPADAIKRTAAELKELIAGTCLSEKDIVAVGLGCPGTMDIPSGYLLEPPNLLSWWNFPIRDELAAATGRPVTFANDGAAAAAGEHWVGSGEKFSSIVMLTLGTGVGGGIIVADLSIDGENSHGSECGHIIIDSSDDARKCSCGQKGHLEAYASATAVVRRMQEALARGEKSVLSDGAGNDNPIDGLRIAQAAAGGDSLSCQIVLETADYLSIAVVSLVHTIDPGAVILGGAMDFGGKEEPLGREFLERIRSSFRRLAFPVPAQKTKIDFAKLGGDAGYIGAAGLARNQWRLNKS